ncbi:MAG: DUF1501 domain-containing protein [Acidobacteria bacterium]|nr:DUF1501 domain-containing protein [Acidobacteriota bacterium]
MFFQVAGGGVAGYFMSPFDLLGQQSAYSRQGVVLGTAKNVIFILLAGAPSQIDTFDLRVDSWTPVDFAPATINGIDFPAGLFPNIARILGRLTIVRSCLTNALVHPLSQTWSQIARNPTSALGRIAPNIGAVVALETERTRTNAQPLPGFVSLNTGGNIIREGYLAGRYGPFDVAPANNGVANIQHPDGQQAFADRYELLRRLNRGGVTRADFEQVEDFYETGKRLMNDPAVNNAFRYTNQEQQRYGTNAFGRSCIIARNLVHSDLGTRYIQINLGGWDHHQNIYDPNSGIYGPARQLDLGLSNLILDLESLAGANGRTRLDETLIVVKGEFGRTVGEASDQEGRDHYPVHFCLFAGGGVVGGRVIGSTSAGGHYIEDPGWSQYRHVSSEDIAATIYSALGIDYTTIRRDDPFDRGFEYVAATEWGVDPLVDLFQ